MGVSSVKARTLPRALLILFFGGIAARLQGAIGVSLTAEPPGPAPVGTMITWSALVSDVGSGNLWYRFRVRELGGDFRVIRDYGPLSTLDWTSIDEGVYELEVSVRDRDSGDAETAKSTIPLVSRVQDNLAAVSPTSHPLVFLYNGPGCDAGQARVRFQTAETFVQYTPSKLCVPGRSMSFYLAGLLPDSTYSASLVVDRGRDSTSGPAVSFQTGSAPSTLPLPSILQELATPGPQPILVQATLNQAAIATDLSGRLLWFGPSDLNYITRPAAGGTFFGLHQSGADMAVDVVRRFDLVGMTVQETNAARVSEQLAALGKRPISGFHHEARSLADGKTVVLGDVEMILTDVQGPGPVDVIGDMILVLDEDLRVVWSWDAFDHLDPFRSAVLGESCAQSPGCPSHYLSTNATDWTHGNSVDEAPDGALLYSARHQDWLIKIDYQGGAGNGDVIWRLGRDGDFTYDSTDPYPWFSHQHDAGYVPNSRNTIALFDNGNTRRVAYPGAWSRGQVIELDEKNRTVRAVLNADLNVYSSALGSAQRLEDGTYHFNAGFISSAGLTSMALSIQLDPSGNEILSSITLPAPAYRSFRLNDLYGEGAAPTRPTTQTVDPR